MANKLFTEALVRELQAEYPSTKKCLERMTEKLFDYKPHPTSMEMGYLAQLVAEIPQWVALTAEQGVIDFASYPRYNLTTAADLLRHFEKCFQYAISALQQTDDDKLNNEEFRLQRDGQVLMKSSKMESIHSTINHWVHHRGQLTVYMRMNEIPVPSIYGPSADDKTFQ